MPGLGDTLFTNMLRMASAENQRARDDKQRREFQLQEQETAAKDEANRRISASQLGMKQDQDAWYKQQFEVAEEQGRIAGVNGGEMPVYENANASAYAQKGFQIGQAEASKTKYEIDERDHKRRQWAAEFNQRGEDQSARRKSYDQRTASRDRNTLASEKNTFSEPLKLQLKMVGSKYKELFAGTSPYKHTPGIPQMVTGTGEKDWGSRVQAKDEDGFKLWKTPPKTSGDDDYDNTVKGLYGEWAQEVRGILMAAGHKVPPGNDEALVKAIGNITMSPAGSNSERRERVDLNASDSAVEQPNEEMDEIDAVADLGLIGDGKEEEDDLIDQVLDGIKGFFGSAKKKRGSASASRTRQ